MLRLPLLASAAALMLTPAIAAAQTQTGAPTMVSATGPIISLNVTESVQSAPDMATINTGVQTRALTAKDAMAQNAAQMDKLIAALLKAGIERKDLQTSGINLNPQYDYSNRTDGQGPRFVGYEASNQLSVTVRKLDKAGEMVDTMIGAGATNVNGPSFGILDTSRLEEEARTKALKSAQERADFYARNTGHRGARLIAITEAGSYTPPQPMMMARDIAVAAAAPQSRIEPGQLNTAITLSFQYVLER